MAAPGAAGPTWLGSSPRLAPPSAPAASSGCWLAPPVTLIPGDGGTTHFTATPVHASQSPGHGGGLMDPSNSFGTNGTPPGSVRLCWGIPSSSAG